MVFAMPFKKISSVRTNTSGQVKSQITPLNKIPSLGGLRFYQEAKQKQMLVFDMQFLKVISNDSVFICIVESSKAYKLAKKSASLKTGLREF